MNAPVEFVLPTPPTANLLYRVKKGQHGQYKSAAYKNWTARAWAWGKAQNVKSIEGLCAVEYIVPQNRRRDLDNYFKPLNDSLQMLGVVANDRQIRALAITEEDRDDVLVRLRPYGNGKFFLYGWREEKPQPFDFSGMS